MSIRKKKNIILLISVLMLFFFVSENFKILAQDANFNPVQICPAFVKNINKECEKLGDEQCRKTLEQCEKYYQGKSSQYQTEISKIKQKEKSLENEIWRLTNEIKNFSHKINKNNLIIKDINFQLKDTEESINKTNSEIDRIKGKIGILLQLRYEQDQKSILEIFLAESTLSVFFDDLVALESLNRQTQELLKHIKALKSSLERQKDLMFLEKEELEYTQILVALQKEEGQELKVQKNDILTKTKGQESLYQKYLIESKSKAQEIRKKIFELAQVTESRSLTLEEAYGLAKEIGKITGIRPAFLLGLLKIESDIGKNVGQCNCKGLAFCRYPDISWKQVMTQNHWSYFKQIVKELGLDINATPVSCSINGGKVQWGGAMGPAQFMPGTWLNHTSNYKVRIEKITGIVPANPWRIKDAFLASALYLSDFGAGSQKEINEMKAARAYLCGTTTLTWICRIAGGENYVYKIMQQASIFQSYVDQGVFD